MRFTRLMLGYPLLVLLACGVLTLTPLAPVAYLAGTVALVWFAAGMFAVPIYWGTRVVIYAIGSSQATPREPPPLPPPDPRLDRFR